MTDEMKEVWPSVQPAELPLQGVLVLQVDPWRMNRTNPGTACREFSNNMKTVYEKRNAELDELVYHANQSPDVEKAQVEKIKASARAVLVHLMTADGGHRDLEQQLVQSLTKEGVAVWLVGVKSATTGQATVYPPQNGKPYSVTVDLAHT